MKRLFFYVGGILVLIVGFVFLLTINTQKSQIITDPSKYNAFEDRTYWIKQIKTSGAEEAYQKFVEENNDSLFEVQHIRAHVMGEALFETEDIHGIAICDANFGFGCFHGLFTVGFASRGNIFIQESNAMCLDRYGPLGTGCQHGIGHGIVEYVGHDNLTDALNLCDETSQPTPLLGCTSGVFMEHNTPFTVLPGEETQEPYRFVEEKPYAACNTVDERHLESCYYELGGWWEVVLKGDKLKMGRLCSEISNSKLRNMCALGLGNIIGPTNSYDVVQSSVLCQQMPENVVAFCHAGAAWSLFSNPKFSEKATDICDALDGAQQEICMQNYNLAQ